MAASRPMLDRDSLKQALCEAVDKYLTIDNPKPNANASYFAKAAAAAVSMYSRKGSTGRQRAADYKRSIEKSDESCSALLVRVTDDIKQGDSCLDTSNALRNRLLEALCNVYGINDRDIAIKLREARKAAISAVTFAGAQAYAPIPSEDVLRRSAIMTLLSRHIALAKSDVNLEKNRETVAARAAMPGDNPSLIGNNSL